MKLQFKNIWLKFKKPLLFAFVILLLAFVFLNIIAKNHAEKFTHFSSQKQERIINIADSSFAVKSKALFWGIPISKPTNSEIDFDFVEIDTISGKLNLEIWKLDMEPSKGIVALFHGYRASKSSLWKEALAFYRMGYSVILVDFRASGNSDGDTCSIGYYEAEDVQNVIHWCNIEYPDKKIFLYGASMGAAAIMRAVSQLNINPNAIMLQSPFGTMLGAAKSRFKLMGVPAFPSAHLLTFWGGYINDFDAFSHNPMDYAKNIHCPTLLIHGQLDNRVSWEESKGIFDQLAGPKELATFGKSGHESILNHEEANWVYLVTNFMETQNQ